jgi:hypothetical protein
MRNLRGEESLRDHGAEQLSMTANEAGARVIISELTEMSGSDASIKTGGR